MDIMFFGAVLCRAQELFGISGFIGRVGQFSPML
jgi:hypothetical protein